MSRKLMRVCVATAVRAMRHLAAHSVMYPCGEYAHRVAGHASFVLTHSATLNARVILYNIVYIYCTQRLKVDAYVATAVRAMRSPAAHSVMYTYGEYAHRAAGHASFVLTHSATLNARAILYNIVYIYCIRNA